MKAASVSALKSELSRLSSTELRDVSLKLARFRTENKELLTYLLFYDNDEADFIKSVKEEIDLLFDGINTNHLYFVRKSIRKIIRLVNKYIRFSGNKQTEVELRLYFVSKLQKSGIALEPGSALGNLFFGQAQRIKKAIAGLHEDLQYDFQSELAKFGLD